MELGTDIFYKHTTYLHTLNGICPDQSNKLMRVLDSDAGSVFLDFPQQDMSRD